MSRVVFALVFVACNSPREKMDTPDPVEKCQVGNKGVPASLFSENAFESFDESLCAKFTSTLELNAGRYHSVAGGEGPFSYSSFHADECGDTVQMNGPRETFLSERGMYWNRSIKTNDYQWESALLLCGEEDGVLRGYVRGCYQTRQGTECWGPFPSDWKRLPENETASGIEVIGSYTGVTNGDFVANIRVVGDVAFTVGFEGLRSFDISNPTAPAAISHYDEGRFFNDIKLVKGGEETFALLAAQDELVIVDVTNPAEMLFVTQFSTFGTGPHTLFVDEREGVRTAYLAGGFTGVGVVDVTNPRQPFAKARIDMNEVGEPMLHDLYVENGVLYLNAESLFAIYRDDVPGGTLLGVWYPPEELPMYSHSNWVTEVAGRKIAVHGGEGQSSQIHIIDVNPESEEFMTVIGEWRHSIPEISAHNIMVVGRKAYVAHYQAGLRVLDLSDPTKPVEVGNLPTWKPGPTEFYFEGAAGVDMDADGTIYISNSGSNGGFVIARELDD